ncbi:alpha-ketoglutarate-dependent dioxygenase AlkB [Marinicella litoralis]|uniref:DNA alkylation damage repair protein AlkB n=1 Tax=Marinicella litoralis TaxID=644220 RepID=A0A4R6XQI7_9GAMM|nr:alpha-ketoglutarate-dependent dioxygenase AlkB [Marinicella litoralis]TDR20480.1 DNA alkylation damage repair protein AlkB [Marinicella litoralis]
MNDLFSPNSQLIEEIQKDIYLLRNFTSYESLIDEVKAVTAQAPFRFMHTPGGKKLNISMTNCGDLGWISEPTGYRYAAKDPSSKRPWPAMPQPFKQLALTAARHANFKNFQPNACLINHYKQGRVLTAHQDKNEPDLSQPIVSVSLGMSARFQIYGDARNNKPLEIELYDGDVMVWGRSARLIYHGVKTKHSIPHPNLGAHRINLTLRKV